MSNIENIDDQIEDIIDDLRRELRHTQDMADQERIVNMIARLRESMTTPITQTKE